MRAKAYEAVPQDRGGSSAAWLLKIVRNTDHAPPWKGAATSSCSETC